MKLFGVCPVVFPFKEKGFPRKSLCFCVVVLPLCLLKFIHSNIEFFPTGWTHDFKLGRGAGKKKKSLCFVFLVLVPCEILILWRKLTSGDGRVQHEEIKLLSWLSYSTWRSISYSTVTAPRIFFRWLLRNLNYTKFNKNRTSYIG